MQTAQAIIGEIGETVSGVSVGLAREKSRRVFDLFAVVTDFCNWYCRRLANKNLQVTTRISPNIPIYIQGNQNFIETMLMEPARNSLLYAGGGAVSVEVDAKQHTRRRYSLTVTLTLAGSTISAAKKKELFRAGATLSERDGLRLRSTNLYYARMIAHSFSGDIRIECSPRTGLRYLVEASLFCPPS